MENVIELEQKETKSEKTPVEWQQYWETEMSAANKRLRKYRRQGNDIVNRYLDKRTGDTGGYAGSSNSPHKLNLFHSNILTLQSMLFGSIPKIDVSREHPDPNDDIARVAAMLFQRILTTDCQSSGSDLPTVLKAALQDRLLPGFGLARVRYEYETESTPSMNPATGKIEETEMITSETAPIDYLHWQDVSWGWCRTWSEMPWIAFRSWLTKSEVSRRFGKTIANNLEYKNQLPDGNQESARFAESEQKNNTQKAEVWEIWCKPHKKVFWWSQGASAILDAQDDPLELKGFWPCPRPMIANQTTTLMIPTADYVLVQDLYNQIDELNTRISVITRAIKVVGVYDRSSGDSVGRMLSEGNENDLIPVDNWAMFAEKGGLQGAINWFPVQDVVGVLQTLREVLNDTIAQLNQVTGMSDIMRGSAGGQYTAASSNQMAAKMGSINVQALQDEFARFASELEGLKAEVISKHYEPQSIIQQSSAFFVPEADKDKVMLAVELMKSPEIFWRVEIRPESIAMVDYAQLKQERTEFLTAMATFVQSAQAAAREIPGSTPILLEMMKWTMAGFKGSTYLEGMMDKVIDEANKAASQPQQQQEPNPEQMKMQIEQMKMQMEQQKSQADLQKIQAKAAADVQTAQVKTQGELAKIQADATRDMELENTQSQYALLEIKSELEAKLQEIEATLKASITEETIQAQQDMRVNDQEHSQRVSEIRISDNDLEL
tara:strand:+ start:2063 stop:4222 length:2160 start_codon:yes stop_codon:yes gene_type:complete